MSIGYSLHISYRYFHFRKRYPDRNKIRIRKTPRVPYIIVELTGSCSFILSELLAVCLCKLAELCKSCRIGDRELGKDLAVHVHACNLQAVHKL